MSKLCCGRWAPNLGLNVIKLRLVLSRRLGCKSRLIQAEYIHSDMECFFRSTFFSSKGLGNCGGCNLVDTLRQDFNLLSFGKVGRRQGMETKIHRLANH
eukprot:scaffold111386_cov17-Prasinocladus_malaysianus.AAC.1